MHRTLPTASRPQSTQSAARQRARLLGSAFDRKQFLESLHIRIDWDKSVFLIHPNLKHCLADTSHDGLAAVTSQNGELYLFGVRLVTDSNQFEQAPPELLVALSPSKERKTIF